MVFYYIVECVKEEESLSLPGEEEFAEESHSHPLFDTEEAAHCQKEDKSKAQRLNNVQPRRCRRSWARLADGRCGTGRAGRGPIQREIPDVDTGCRRVSVFTDLLLKKKQIVGASGVE